MINEPGAEKGGPGRECRRRGPVATQSEDDRIYISSSSPTAQSVSQESDMKVLLALVICLTCGQAQDLAQHRPGVAQQEAQQTTPAAHGPAGGAQRGPRLVQEATGHPAGAQGDPGVAQSGQRVAQQQDPRLAQQALWHPSGLHPASNATPASPWRPLVGVQQAYQQLVQGLATDRTPSTGDSAFLVRPVLQAYQPYTAAPYQQTPQVLNLVELEPEEVEAELVQFQELQQSPLLQQTPVPRQAPLLQQIQEFQRAPELRQARLLQRAPELQQAPELQEQRFLQRRAPSELLATLVYLRPHPFPMTP